MKKLFQAIIAFVFILFLLNNILIYQAFKQLENNVSMWGERTTGLRYEIEWLQKRLDVLEIPKPEPVIFRSNDIMQSVVHIEVDAGWQGSGSYVGNGLILTAGHIVGGEGYGAMEFTIMFEDGTKYISTEFYLEETADVGFIYIGDCNSPVLEFDDEVLNRGDVAFVYGNPYGWDYCFSVTKGIVSSINRDCEGYFGEKIMLQVDAASWPGNSGGPVVDDEGEIIGILVGGVWGSDNLSLCIPVNICEQAMTTYLSILKMAELK